jgi:hypothetical protein
LILTFWLKKENKKKERIRPCEKKEEDNKRKRRMIKET